MADVIEGADRGGGDGDGPVLVAVGVGMMGDGDGDWDWDWEEVCWDSGRWEYVDGNLDGAGVEGQGQGQREGEGNGFGGEFYFLVASFCGWFVMAV